VASFAVEVLLNKKSSVPWSFTHTHTPEFSIEKLKLRVGHIIELISLYCQIYMKV
jgi:hypothetical protein